MIYDWLKSKKYHEKKHSVVPYTIGVTAENKIQMRINADNISTSLTMSPLGVVRLIEDLAHSIRKDYKVIINKVGDSK